MSGINPSVDRVSRTRSVNTDVVATPTATDKYDNSRHLKYGQTENQKKTDVSKSKKNHEKKEEESSFRPELDRRYASSSDSAPTLHHTFYEEFLGGVTESKIVAEVTFGESASGAAILQGAYVGADQTLATALRLSDHLMEAAQRYFNLAITNNFIQGRKTQHVIAACLYIVCRTEKTCHMLIDFSDILQVNVFTLGSTFLKLVNTLHLVLPLIDPSIYITRFASMLEFGEETGRVANDAARLCQRMERDWMQTEFRETPTAKLTVRDFRVVWLEQESDPPSFTRARKAEKNAIDRRQQASSAEHDGNDQIQTNSSQQNETVDDDIEDESSDVLQQKNAIEEQIDRELEEEMNTYLNDPALKQISSEMEANKKGSEIMDDEEIGSDFDDDEIRNIVLSEEEVKIKTQVWMDMNHEYLKEVEAKRKKQEIDRANGIGVRKSDDQTVASTPAEAARRLFEERNLSKKINFKILDSLFDNIAGGSIPNTPTSWRDYDPTSVSGSGIARSGTPASSRWEDDEEFGDYYDNSYDNNYDNNYDLNYDHNYEHNYEHNDYYSNDDYYDEGQKTKRENEQIKNEQIKHEQIKNEQIKRENEQIKRENEQIKRENERIKRENERIKRENDQIKIENDQSKRENENEDRRAHVSKNKETLQNAFNAIVDQEIKKGRKITRLFDAFADEIDLD
ncbi:8691_t:CDS:10, partial [Racocetra fulgida]